MSGSNGVRPGNGLRPSIHPVPPAASRLRSAALIRPCQLSSCSTTWTARSSNDSASRTTRNGNKRQPSDLAMPSSAEHHDDAVYACETTHTTASAQRSRS